MERAIPTADIHMIKREVLVHISRQLSRGYPGHADICGRPVVLAYPALSGIELMRAVLIEPPRYSPWHLINEREAGEPVANREATEMGADRLEHVFNQTLQSPD